MSQCDNILETNSWYDTQHFVHHGSWTDWPTLQLDSFSVASTHRWWFDCWQHEGLRETSCEEYAESCELEENICHILWLLSTCWSILHVPVKWMWTLHSIKLCSFYAFIITVTIRRHSSSGSAALTTVMQQGVPADSVRCDWGVLNTFSIFSRFYA